MVKRKTARQKIKAKEAKKIVTEDGIDETFSKSGKGEGGQPQFEMPGRAKRKIAKQLRFISKVQETQKILGANRLISKKKKKHRGKKSGNTVYNLAALAESLPSLDKKDPAANSDSFCKVLNNRARQQLVVKETKQLAMVLNHPEFKANPFSAIQQHLTNILGPDTDVTAKPSEKPRKKKKKAKGKSIMGVKHMDIL